MAGKSLRMRVLRQLATCSALTAWCLFVPLACMTPDKAVRQSDEAGLRLATEFWQRQTGCTNTFDIHRPADALTLRIALLAASRGEQHVVFPQIPHVEPKWVSNSVLRLTLSDALCIAARNNRKYQKLKEDVFLRALDVDYQQYAFETSFSGLMLGALSGDLATKKATGGAEAGAKRQLPDGADIAGRLALDLVSLLREDWRSVALSGDLTATVPLMRGAGRDIVMEPLTQAQRDLIYAIRSYEYYRQTYAVSVASGYYYTLQLREQLKNAVENERRLDRNSRRANMLFGAGRMQRIQVDQAKTDLLNAGQGVITARKNLEYQLDSFKTLIGLPPEGPVELDADELHRLETHAEQAVKSSMSVIALYPDADEACRIALEQRQDLFVTRCQLEDEERGVKVAADALRADVALSGGLSLDRKRVTGDNGFSGEETWTGGLRVGFPWDRRKERNAYKKQLIALEQAKRALEEQEDAVKLSVRSGLRNVVAAQQSYKTQVEAMKVARLRVESNNLFLESGRSTMRDILEAESAMLSARNAFCSAVIQWRMSDLELRRDMGVLVISEAGMWSEIHGENHG